MEAYRSVDFDASRVASDSVRAFPACLWGVQQQQQQQQAGNTTSRATRSRTSSSRGTSSSTSSSTTGPLQGLLLRPSSFKPSADLGHLGRGAFGSVRLVSVPMSDGSSRVCALKRCSDTRAGYLASAGYEMESR